MQATFVAFEYFYNIVFTVELAVNMYASWLYDFWNSGWNVFDFVVVSIGLLDMSNAPLPGPLSMLRMMRAFRVFRLFKRVKSLKKIIVSLAKAVPGVMNAFFIMLLVMCIYAILAVELFRDVGRDGFIDFESKSFGSNDDPDEGYFTSRGGWYGKEYFGTFLKALYTLFQVGSRKSYELECDVFSLKSVGRGAGLILRVRARSSMVAVGCGMWDFPRSSRVSRGRRLWQGL